MKNKFFSVFVFFVCFMSAVTVLSANGQQEASNPDNPAETTQSSRLEPDVVLAGHHRSSAGMDIYWTFTAHNTIIIALQSPASGWISIGFEPERRMDKAKILIAGFESGSVTLEEHIGTSATSHALISENYVLQYVGERTDEFTFVEFELPLSGNSRYTMRSGEKQRVILAYHSNSDSFVVRHSRRSTEEIHF